MTILIPSQCRAARALLDWTQAQLAEESGIALSTLQYFENGKRTPISSNLTAIRGALEKAGVQILIEGNSENEIIGVILKNANSANLTCTLLCGSIIQAYAKIEFIITDLFTKCGRIQAYKEMTSRTPSKLSSKAKILKMIVSRPGPLHGYASSMQKLLDEVVNFETLRNFIAHGAISLVTHNDPVIVYRMYREQKAGGEISELNTTLDYLQKSARSIERVSKELAELAARITKD